MNARRKVILLEINEVTWDLIDPFIAQGKLPVLAKLKREGGWASPMSIDLPPQLDPWITWTTVYTGRTQDEHNMFFLEQPPETIKAPRIWEICADAGLRVGVYGSVGSWPPNRKTVFHVPESFAQDFSTNPPELQPIQELNLTYTRSIRLPSDKDTLWFKMKLGARLLQLGLKPSTIYRIVSQLVRERLNPEIRWQRVVLQPTVNFDFFEKQYRSKRPQLATFHTNHVAHFMHTYWKAMQPELFPQETSAKEIRIYGNAIEYGYRSADALIGKVLSLMDESTVLVIASSLGHQPYISNLKKGKAINQLKSLDQLLEILGVKGKARALNTMSDQFNIYAESAPVLKQIENALRTAHIAAPNRPMFTVMPLDDCLTATLKRYDETTNDSRIVFPALPSNNTFRYGSLVHSTGLVKSGCHHPKGMLVAYGAGIRPGASVASCNNLDIAPTLFALMGLPVPAEMKGRVLSEILDFPVQVRPGPRDAKSMAAHS